MHAGCMHLIFFLGVHKRSMSHVEVYVWRCNTFVDSIAPHVHSTAATALASGRRALMQPGAAQRRAASSHSQRQGPKLSTLSSTSSCCTVLASIGSLACIWATQASDTRGAAVPPAGAPAPALAASPTPGAAAPCATGAMRARGLQKPASSETAGKRPDGTPPVGQRPARTYLQQAEQAAARAGREAASKQVRLEQRRGLLRVRAVRRAAEAGAARAPARGGHCCVMFVGVTRGSRLPPYCILHACPRNASA